MSLCILAGGKVLALAVSLFTLGWTHSVERTQWQETWSVSTDGLQVIEARVKGSGAGMEPPDGAKLKNGWWIYRPGLPPRRRIVLAASGATGAGWMLCAAGRCRQLGAVAGESVELFSCDGEAGPAGG